VVIPEDIRMGIPADSVFGCRDGRGFRNGNAGYEMMKRLWGGSTLTVAFLFALPVGGAELAGQVSDAAGKPLAGALVSVSVPDSLFTETVYSDGAGRYRLRTRQNGTVLLRARKYGHADIVRNVELRPGRAEDFRLVELTDAEALSDSLTASAHLTRLHFDDPADRQWFQVDCLTCHLLGNGFTRARRTPERWREILSRMLGFYGVSDAHWVEHYAQVLTAAFDGRPLVLHQQDVVAPETFSALIMQWKIPAGVVAHDVEYSPRDGRLYVVDQGNDSIYIIDPINNGRETFRIPDTGIPVGGKFLRLFNNPSPGGLVVSRGPHSLQLGPDGKFYTADSVSSQIGIFDPATKTYTARDIGGNALYPHTLRCDGRARLWFTLTFSNQVGYLDSAGGAVRVIDLPGDTARPAMPSHAPYGIDVNPLDGSVWYSSLLANRIGRIDPDTFEVRTFTPPTIGPRRMRFAADGTLWIPGYGDGVLLRLDTRTMRFKRYVIPMLSPGEVEAPYAVGVHPHTGDVWITGNASDRLLRFLPGEERFIAYALPTRGMFLRDVIFTPEGWVCSGSSPVPAPVAVEGGMQEVVCIDPGGA
jgi:YVTN family beta-propeller protein